MTEFMENVTPTGNIYKEEVIEPTSEGSEFDEFHFLVVRHTLNIHMRGDFDNQMTNIFHSWS